jgi:hypothetical protein
MSHFRHCPKHRKPLPCAHCVAAKPVQTAPSVAVMEPVRSKAAIRAQKFRERQKQKDPGFNKKEAERKQTEREDTERKKALEEALESGQFPTNLNSLRNRTGKNLFMMKAPQGCGLVETGGYDVEKMEKVEAAHMKARRGRVTPKGEGPKSDSGRHGNERIPSSYSYIPPKDVKVMRRFIQNCMDERNVPRASISTTKTE